MAVYRVYPEGHLVFLDGDRLVGCRIVVFDIVRGSLARKPRVFRIEPDAYFHLSSVGDRLKGVMQGIALRGGRHIDITRRMGSAAIEKGKEQMKGPEVSRGEAEEGPCNLHEEPCDQHPPAPDRTGQGAPHEVSESVTGKKKGDDPLGSGDGDPKCRGHAGNGRCHKGGAHRCKADEKKEDKGLRGFRLPDHLFDLYRTNSHHVEDPGFIV